MAENSDTENNDYQLPDDTLSILQQFLVKKEYNNATAMPPEDWQLSQFWYSEDTICRLVDEAIKAIGDNGGQIACISCPSLVSALLEKAATHGKVEVTLFEYDTRFATRFPTTFVYYDYRQPLEIPHGMQQFFDLLIVDPPFISDECLVKTAQTVRLLSKPEAKILLCTGSVVHELAYRLLKVRPTDFRPTHEKNLANEFSAYTNYTPISL